MQKIAEIYKCTGCHACFNICPKHCISMESDKEGFLYPFIDESKCINCGKCKIVCPVLKDYKGRTIGSAFACINNNQEIRDISSSGGIFTLLAEKIIDDGGVVFGAAFDEVFNVHHIEITEKSDLYKLRGSKYVQSCIEDTYTIAKSYLESGKAVLFSGTPCQISGLKSFLGIDYENLIMIDIICHGVPSRMVWQRYLRFREKSACASTQRTNFRHKKYGWNSYSVRLEYSNGTEYEQIFSKDLFMRGFLANLCLRPSCYSCHSKSLQRESDITLADFWGVENVTPEIFDDKGTSLVFVNSEKGRWLFDKISSQMTYKEVDIYEAVEYNTSAYKSVKYNKNRDKFMKLVKHVSFEKAINRCFKESFCHKLIKKIKRILKGVYNYVHE